MIRTALGLLLWTALAPPRYFVVKVVDEQTGRGVPLVCLTTQNEVQYWTDSAGVVAMDEPSLAGREVFFAVRSHGYEYPKEELFGRGLVLKVEPGETRVVKVRRTMIAERLYRLTGEGIYRDSVLAGLPVPLRQPLLNGQVFGQDTASTAVYQGRVFWIWGDTIGPAQWNFNVSGAVSDLPGHGGLDPSIGVDYRYFTKDGWSRAMLPLPRKGLVWMEGLFTVKDPQGRERLLATWTRQDGLKEPDERGVALFDDARQVFEPWMELPWRTPHVSAHPFRHDGFLYLYPTLRVSGDWSAVRDAAQWQRREVLYPPGLRFSCMAWNEYRRRFLALFEKSGEVWLAEAERPEGPFTTPIRVINHEKYTFYNVVTHPFFNQEGGRVIYLEGTYTDAFSDAKEKTPRYNYNQVMYRLRLDDDRLRDSRIYR